MEKKKFHITAPLTVIVLVVIIAVGAFLVYAISQKDKPVEPITLSNTVVQDTTTTVPDEVSEDVETPTATDLETTTNQNESEDQEEAIISSLSTFTDDIGGISFKYPSTWKTEVAHTDAPVNRPGRKIDTKVAITTELGDSYSVSIPAPEIGFEAWTFKDPAKITGADGKKYDRRTGTRTDNSSGVNKNFYYAWTPNENVDSVMVVGGGSTMPESLIAQLDALIATITVQE